MYVCCHRNDKKHVQTHTHITGIFQINKYIVYFIRPVPFNWCIEKVTILLAEQVNYDFSTNYFPRLCTLYIMLNSTLDFTICLLFVFFTIHMNFLEMGTALWMKAKFGSFSKPPNVLKTLEMNWSSLQLRFPSSFLHGWRIFCQMCDRSNRHLFGGHWSVNKVKDN